MTDNPQGSNPQEPTPPPAQPSEPSTPPPTGDVGKDAKTFGMLCHLLALVGYILPFGNILGPLIIWLMKKEDHPFVDEQGKEAINFQITMTIAAIVCILLFVVGIGIILLPLVGLFDLIMIIVASVKANSGEHYRYPFAIRLIK